MENSSKRCVACVALKFEQSLGLGQTDMCNFSVGINGYFDPILSYLISSVFEQQLMDAVR